MKNIHIHKDTYYINFIYEGKPCFAMINSNEIDIDSDLPVVIVNSYGIPTAATKKTLLGILREDKTTYTAQYTEEQYLNGEPDNFLGWEKRS